MTSKYLGKRTSSHNTWEVCGVCVGEECGEGEQEGEGRGREEVEERIHT